MKRTMLLCALIICAGLGFADDASLGLYGSTEFDVLPDGDQVYSRFSAAEDLDPGILVSFRDREAGGSLDFGFMFRPDEPVVSGPDNTWWMDFTFNGTADYHLLGTGIPIDPFIGIGGGFGMIVDVTDYEEYGYDEDFAPHGDDGLTHFSFYPLIRGGLNLYVGNFFVRTHADIRPFDWALPIQGVQTYGQGRIRVLMAMGFRFD